MKQFKIRNKTDPCRTYREIQKREEDMGLKIQVEKQNPKYLIPWILCDKSCREVRKRLHYLPGISDNLKLYLNFVNHHRPNMNAQDKDVTIRHVSKYLAHLSTME